MSRVQLALNVKDLDKSIDFYSKMFNAKPAKTEDGYANFAIESPPLKLVLFENPDADENLNHLGVEVSSSEEVSEQSNRVSSLGLNTEVQQDTDCCYALQDKVWISGGEDPAWEFYTVKQDTEQLGTCCS